MNTKQIGNLGEQLAAEYLLSKGYDILDKNYRKQGTEIDIIAVCGEELVFVEVKTRRSRTFGDAYEAVTPLKMQHIIQTSQLYLQEKQYYQYMVRYDIIEVYLSEGKIEHIENAFTLA